MSISPPSYKQNRLKQLRADGRLQIMELPPVRDSNDYDFENPWPVHIVNCPTPMTIDSALHLARSLDQ